MHTSARRGTRKGSGRGHWIHRLIVTALLVGGMTAIAWPVGETVLGDQTVATEVTRYVSSVERAAPEVLSDELAEAHRYNDELPADKLNDPWGDDAATSSAAHDEYLATLDESSAMGRVLIPKIQVDLPIFHDATKASLAEGAGHMYGSSLPVGGDGTHAVIAGHTGMRARTYFDRLPELVSGDTFQIEVAGTNLTYQVDQMLVVEPWELEAVQRVDGADYVTLVTCYTPPGSHQQRMLVRGVRVPDPVDTTNETTTSTDSTTTTVSTAGYAPAPVAASIGIQEWMWLRLEIVAATALVLLAILAGWIVVDHRDRRARRRGSTAAAGSIDAPPLPENPAPPKRGMSE